MKAKKVLFITQEIIPYVPESPLALAGRTIPQSVQECGHEIRTFMPRWGNINERRNQLHEVIRLSGMNIIIDDTDHPLIIKVASIQSARMQVYFIDNDDYFHKRQMMFDENDQEYTDNVERAIFYARRARDGEETALVSRRDSLSGLDVGHRSFIYKDGLSRRPSLCQCPRGV